MRKIVRGLFLLAVIFFVAGVFARPVFAVNYVTGAGSREEAKEIACNTTYMTTLKGKQALFFKFTTPAGDVGRLNTWLRVESNSSYDAKFFAFFGSAERVDNENHAKWESTTYKKDFPLLFCKPATTYYLWICGGDAKCEGYLNFSIMQDEDDADDRRMTPATPISIGKKVEASMDTKKDGKITDVDWFSFTTGNEEVYSITAKQGIVESANDDYEKFGLKITVCQTACQDDEKSPGKLTVEYNTTGSANIRLKSNTEYLLKIEPNDFEMKEGVPESHRWEVYWEQGYPSMYSPYSFRIDASKLRPWETKKYPPTELALSEILDTSVVSSWDGENAEWYAFTTKSAGKYKVTIRREPISWEEAVEKSDLATVLYDANGKRLGNFIVPEEETGYSIFSLKANAKYFLMIYPTNFDGWDPAYDYEYYEPDELPFAAAEFKLRVTLAKDDTLDKATVTYTKKWTYTGKEITPAVKVVYNGKTLKKGTDYTVSYANNTKPGKASIKVTGKGSYGESKTVSFAIYPKKEALSSVTSLAAQKVTVKIKKDSTVKGYQISYSLTSDFKKSKTVSTSSLSKTLKLTSGKKYYFRVRGIALYGSKEIYGAWSAVKSVKVK